MKPRTECGSQPVAPHICAIVAPSRRRRSAMSVSALVPTGEAGDGALEEGASHASGAGDEAGARPDFEDCPLEMVSGIAEVGQAVRGFPARALVSVRVFASAGCVMICLRLRSHQRLHHRKPRITIAGPPTLHYSVRAGTSTHARVRAEVQSEEQRRYENPDAG